MATQKRRSPQELKEYLQERIKSLDAAEMLKVKKALESASASVDSAALASRGRGWQVQLTQASGLLKQAIKAIQEGIPQ